MQSENLRNWYLISITGIVFSVVLILFLTHILPGQSRATKSVVPVVRGNSVEVNTNVVASPEINLMLPLRLKIPRINVEANVESVGLTPDGDMGIPQQPANAAWFNLGPWPGDQGSAVIDGHSGIWEDDTATVFENLYKLQPGDKLYVEDKTGTTTFVVRESKIYDPAADASAVFSSNDGRAHLNLITCEGAWSEDLKSYTNRLVVFTDKETE